MSRFTGPRLKVMRSLGVDLPGLSKKTIQNRPHRPGQHGLRQQHRRSDFGLQLAEKQKLRFNYGLSERQMRRMMTEAKSSRGNSGDKFAELLERRLDNVIFRAGFAPTIPAARQLVTHGHLLVNGKRTTIASFRVKVGDVITLRERSRSLDIVKMSLQELALIRPEWISWNEGALEAKVVHLPEANDVPFPIEMQLVVEYYAKRL